MNSTHRLEGKIYRVEQNPRRTPPVVVRLAAFGRNELDDLPLDRTRDHVATGASLEEAIDRVLAAASIHFYANKD